MYAYEYKSPSTRLILKLATMFENNTWTFLVTLAVHLALTVALVTTAIAVGDALKTALFMVAIFVFFIGFTVISLASVEACAQPRKGNQ